MVLFSGGECESQISPRSVCVSVRFCCSLWVFRFGRGVDSWVWEVQGMVWVLGYGLNVRLASGLRPGDSEVMYISLFHMFVFHSVSLHTFFHCVVSLEWAFCGTAGSV